MKPEEVELVKKYLSGIMERLEIVAGTLNFGGFPRGTQVAMHSTLNSLAEILITNKEISPKLRQTLVELHNELAELGNSGISDKAIFKDKFLAIITKLRDNLTSREFYGYTRVETTKLQAIIKSLIAL